MSSKSAPLADLQASVILFALVYGKLSDYLQEAGAVLSEQDADRLSDSAIDDLRTTLLESRPKLDTIMEVMDKACMERGEVDPAELALVTNDLMQTNVTVMELAGATELGMLYAALNKAGACVIEACTDLTVERLSDLEVSDVQTED